MRKNIIRKERTARDPYTRILRDVLEDGGLTLAAKGLLCYILSKPDNWYVIPSELAANAGVRKSRPKVGRVTHPAVSWLPISEDTIYRLLRELVSARYAWCEWHKMRGEGGRWESESTWRIYEDKDRCTADLLAYHERKKRFKKPCNPPDRTGATRFAPAQINTN